MTEKATPDERVEHFLGEFADAFDAHRRASPAARTGARDKKEEVGRALVQAYRDRPKKVSKVVGEPP